MYYAYGFTICKSQGNNHIGIHTIVHLNSRKKIPRRQLYVAFSRTDKIDNLIIVGSFEDPWFREEEARKKSGGHIREDEIREGYSQLLAKKIILTWSPLYNTSVRVPRKAKIVLCLAKIFFLCKNAFK